MPEYLIAVLVVAGLVPLLWVIFLVILWREVRELRVRIERLERGTAAAVPVIPTAGAPPVAPAGLTRPSAAPAISPPSPVPLAPAVAPQLPPPASPPAHPIAAPAHPAPTRPTRTQDRLEEQIGGIWMQNVGSVLLLLGAFFLIVWGYANGRIGPEVLVLAGVALGIVVAWRGHVIGRTLNALGNAFIGVGLGVVYITLYLGHFRMHVFPGAVAFTLLAATSLITVAIGLRRREPIIATLGVIAAYLPQLLAVWIPLQGFKLALPALLGYFAVVNVVVFALAASVGWSGLVLLSLVLTTVTWSANAGLHAWSLGIQLALSGLFVALGLAPVARLVRHERPVRSIDLAVVASAPMLLLLASWPFLVAPDRLRAALLLSALAALYAAVSIGLERRRAERDLWRPLTATATVFLAAGIERGLLPEYLALAWCAEGAALLWLGMGPRGAWLRLLGYTVLSVAAVRLLWVLLTGASPAVPSLLSAPALRDLLVIGVFLLASHLIGRRRDLLAPEERLAPGGWVFVANALLMIWAAREMGQVRHFLPQVSGSDNDAIAVTLAGCAWMIQCFVLFQLSIARSAPVLRQVGYFVGGFAVLALFTGHAARDPWIAGSLPLLNTAALIVAFATTLLILGAELLWRHRDRLSPGERRIPEVATAVANLVLLAWWAREAGHLASALTPSEAAFGARGPAVRTLAAVFTSAAWTLQAVVLFALGWLRGSAFLRWSGLVLFGLTVLKFLLVDLDRVDAFWRFVSALGIGAALLVVSFLYQRKARSAGSLRGSPETR